MTAYKEDTIVDTSSIEYSNTGIRLLKFVKTVYGNEVLDGVQKGKYVVWFNETVVKFDTSFRNYRVKEKTSVNVKREVGVQPKIDETEHNLDEGDHPFVLKPSSIMP